jgi:hypothetical protein
MAETAPAGRDDKADKEDKAVKEDHSDRDGKRILRALKRIAHDKLRNRQMSGRAEAQAPVFKVYTTLEDQVSIPHLAHRNRQQEAFHTTVKPQQPRRSLIRVYRLKGLEWGLYKEEGGRRTRLPTIVQILEAEEEYLLIIKARKRKRPNAPGSSKRKHFDRPNQGRRGGTILYGPHETSQSQTSHHVATGETRQWICRGPRVGNPGFNPRQSVDSE